ncbi:DNA-binding transcriptional regulator AraC [compost metagenome]
MNKAKMLLETTLLKTFEIAERVGMENYRHFNKTFKREVGMSPSEYRQFAQKG